LIHTKYEPKGTLPLGEDEGLYTDVPGQDLRALRRAVLDLDEFVNASSFPNLSPRERDVLRLLGAGLTIREVARHLGVGLNTAVSHVDRIRAKLGGVRTLAELRHVALEGGIEIESNGID
jgi:DNA-binding CsgD family transcriptional regulator